MKEKAPKGRIAKRIASFLVILTMVFTLMPSMSMPVYAMGIKVRIVKDDTVISLDVEPSDTVEAVKDKIEESQGISKDLQILKFKNTVLQNSNVLADYNVQAGEELTLELVSYTVTFHENGHGTAPAQLTSVTHGDKIKAPESPSAEGYDFEGWYKEQACTTEWDFANDTVTTDVDLYAKWNLTEYTISYHLEGGTLATANPTSYTVETDTFTLVNPTKEGYTFVGWTQTNAAAALPEVTITKGTVGNREYTAVWQANHTHTFSSEWSSDETSHWHAATCGDTTEKKDLGKHVYGTSGADRYTCTVCKKVNTQKKAEIELADKEAADTEAANAVIDKINASWKSC